MAKQNSRVANLVGSTLACLGVAHLANPRMLISSPRSTYPRRARWPSVVNGAVVTTLGLGIRAPRTRALATIVGVGYGAHLVDRASRSTRRR